VAETGTTLVAVTHDHDVLKRFARVIDAKDLGAEASE
jgi:ABC-type lipoprotein export system ATPase subunit